LVEKSAIEDTCGSWYICSLDELDDDDDDDDIDFRLFGPPEGY
jgi:hypothetical protein